MSKLRFCLQIPLIKECERSFGTPTGCQNSIRRWNRVFGLLVAKIRFLLQTAPFSLSIPSFGTPQAGRQFSSPAPRHGGVCGEVHRVGGAQGITFGRCVFGADLAHVPGDEGESGEFEQNAEDEQKDNSAHAVVVRWPVRVPGTVSRSRAATRRPAGAGRAKRGTSRSARPPTVAAPMDSSPSRSPDAPSLPAHRAARSALRSIRMWVDCHRCQGSSLSRLRSGGSSRWQAASPPQPSSPRTSPSSARRSSEREPSSSRHHLD